MDFINTLQNEIKNSELTNEEKHAFSTFLKTSPTSINKIIELIKDVIKDNKITETEIIKIILVISMIIKNDFINNKTLIKVIGNTKKSMLISYVKFILYALLKSDLINIDNSQIIIFKTIINNVFDILDINFEDIKNSILSCSTCF